MASPCHLLLTCNHRQDEERRRRIHTFTREDILGNTSGDAFYKKWAVNAAFYFDTHAGRCYVSNDFGNIFLDLEHASPEILSCGSARNISRGSFNAVSTLVCGHDAKLEQGTLAW